MEQILRRPNLAFTFFVRRVNMRGAEKEDSKIRIKLKEKEGERPEHILRMNHPPPPSPKAKPRGRRIPDRGTHLVTDRREGRKTGTGGLSSRSGDTSCPQHGWERENTHP
jgi:hypothetical protein